MKRSHLFTGLLIALCWSGFSANAATTVGPGSQFTFDGVDGPLVPGGVVPDNLAHVSNGATAFAIDVGHSPPHAISGLNNGVYGNPDSWIGIATRDIDVGGGNIVNTTFAGVDFAGTGPHRIASFAFGRSNLGDEFDDRTTGTYFVQLTLTADPDINTADGDWTTIGSIDISSNAFGDTYRHEYTMNSPLDATGIRIVTPGSGTAIDEIEVGVIPEPSTALFGLSGLLCLVLLRRRK